MKDILIKLEKVLIILCQNKVIPNSYFLRILYKMKIDLIMVTLIRTYNYTRCHKKT